MHRLLLIFVSMFTAFLVAPSAIAQSTPSGVTAAPSPQKMPDPGVLTKAELDALRARLAQHWRPPTEVINSKEDLAIVVRIVLSSDGRIEEPPRVMTFPRGDLHVRARDYAVRAIFRSQPFDMLLSATYETWRQLDVTFNPRGYVPPQGETK
jgi:hypothetical protein